MSHPEIHPAVHSVGTGVGESLEDMVRRVQAMADAKFAEIRAEKEAKAEKSAAHYARVGAKGKEARAFAILNRKRVKEMKRKGGD
jgi:hypothetical protein